MAHSILRQFHRTFGQYSWLLLVLLILGGTAVRIAAAQSGEGPMPRRDVETVETRTWSLGQQSGQVLDRVYVLSTLSADPTIQQLCQQLGEVEVEQGIRGMRMRDAHPVMIDLKRQRRNLEDQLLVRSGRVLGETGNGHPGVENPCQIPRLGLSGDGAYVLSALRADPIIQQLCEGLLLVEVEWEMQGRRLLDNHPVMIDLKRQQATLAGVLWARVRKMVGETGNSHPWERNPCPR